MTVFELIEKLKEFPPQMRVVCHDGEYEDFYDIKDIYLVHGAQVKEQYPDEQVLKLSPFDDGVNR